MSGARYLWLGAVPMLLVLALPVFALGVSSSPGAVWAATGHPLFASAMVLSLQTSVMSLGVVVLLGTPLALWLARASAGQRRRIEWLVELPIVLPPAVVGLGLLQGLSSVAFTTTAVILAQVVVSAPFYIQSAAVAFRRVDPDLMLVARSLGQSQWGAVRRVLIPVALPGLLAGAALSWTRALGEFGATLLFAGNLPGTTQTMPLAIYATLADDSRVAVALALVLAVISVVLLIGLRGGAALWTGRR
jgi:molybdate transport system permease protein